MFCSVLRFSLFVVQVVLKPYDPLLKCYDYGHVPPHLTFQTFAVESRARNWRDRSTGRACGGACPNFALPSEAGSSLALEALYCLERVRT